MEKRAGRSEVPSTVHTSVLFPTKFMLTCLYENPGSIRKSATPKPLKPTSAFTKVPPQARVRPGNWKYVVYFSLGV